MWIKKKAPQKPPNWPGRLTLSRPNRPLGRDLDTRADLYSIGASLYYVVTGQFPYNGKNTIDIIQKHINDPVPDPAKIPAKICRAGCRLPSKKLMSKKPGMTASKPPKKSTTI